MLRGSLSSSYGCHLAVGRQENEEARQEGRLAYHPRTQARTPDTDYFQRWGNGNTKTNPIPLHSKSCLFQEDLRTKGLQPTQEEDGELAAEKMETTTSIRKLERKPHRAQEEEKEGEVQGLLIVSDRNQQKSKNDKGGAIALVALLKACAKQKDLHTGGRVHMDIVQSGLLQKNVFVGNALVNMYAKCGVLEKAQEVFDQLVVRDVVSWNVLIAGYAQSGNFEQALRCFEQMQFAGFFPDAVTFVCILMACGRIGALEKGKEVHALIATNTAMETDVHVGTALVDMYAKFGLLSKAQEVFDKLQARNIVSWTALIMGYAHFGQGQMALVHFENMEGEGIFPNAVTFACILKACGDVGATNKGQEIHAKITKEGLLKKNNVVANALVDMYAKCHLLSTAQQVFDDLPSWDVEGWNVLIAGYTRHEHGEQALNCFKRMQHEGFSPDRFTFACAVKACGVVGALYEGQELHAEIVTEGLLESDMVVGTALIDMYAIFGMLAESQDVFDELPFQDVVLWTALITGYTQNGHGEEAFKCFKQMQLRGFFPNAVTFACVLKACGSIGASVRGQIIHLKMEKEGWLERDIVIANALVDMYAKCGLLAEAQEVFDKLFVRDVVSWNALILGYVQNEHFERALNAFELMRLEGFFPDIVTFASILKSCGRIGAVCKGQEIHAEIVRDGLMEENIVVGTALVEMYANCGMLAEAQATFDELVIRDIVLWNALLAGYAQFGDEDVVSNSFQKLIGEGQEPNVVTFAIVLTTFSHGGLLNKGQSYFEILSKSYGTIPSLEHYTCMVDLFGRAGHIEEAISLIEEMHFFVDIAVWLTLLGACRKWGYMNLGSWAFEHAVELDENEAALYVFMSNVL